MVKAGIHHTVKCLLRELYCLILFKETGEPKEIGKPSPPVDAVWS